MMARIAFQQGIANLERLLTLFIPEETTLLHNYPNPFNPETWIPYQLAEPAEVTLTIYAVNGTLVRTLALGHQPAGIYQTRNRAVVLGRQKRGRRISRKRHLFLYTHRRRFQRHEKNVNKKIIPFYRTRSCVSLLQLSTIYPSGGDFPSDNRQLKQESTHYERKPK